MDVVVKQAIAEITRDDAFADFVAELTPDERAALAGQLRTILAEHDQQPRPAGVTSGRSVVLRCGDRGCRGVVAEAVASSLEFVALEKATAADAPAEMAVVQRSVQIDECVESVPSMWAYCPSCWVRYALEEVLREVRVARLLGRAKREMPAGT